jgi:hypothetical protein
VYAPVRMLNNGVTTAGAGAVGVEPPPQAGIRSASRGATKSLERLRIFHP